MANGGKVRYFQDFLVGYRRCPRSSPARISISRLLADRGGHATMVVA
jgi:hypothetical protein